MVMPAGPSLPPHWNTAPPQSETSSPRWSRYHAPSTFGSAALKKIPPIPVTLCMVIPARKEKGSGCPALALRLGAGSRDADEHRDVARAHDTPIRSFDRLSGLREHEYVAIRIFKPALTVRH